jgi:uncharacterized protein (TIGR02271 family)
MNERDPSRSAAPKKRRDVSAVTMPVLAEKLTVQVRRSERARIRISKTVQEDQVTVEPLATRQEISITRVPIDRFIEGPLGVRREGDTLIIPVCEEVPVVVMKTKLKEEVRVTTRTVSERRPTQVGVRREQVTIERIPSDGPSQGTPKKERRTPS